MPRNAEDGESNERWRECSTGGDHRAPAVGAWQAWLAGIRTQNVEHVAEVQADGIRSEYELTSRR